MKISDFIKKIKNYRVEKEINIEELNQIIKTNQNIILLDVRSPQEYKEGHLMGAINIPLYELETNYKNKLNDKKEVVIVYCQSGIRSKKAIKILQKYGFTNLYHLKNGLDGI